MALNNTHRTSAFSTHGPLHWLPAACVGIRVGVVSRARDADFVFGNDKGEGTDAAGSALA